MLLRKLSEVCGICFQLLLFSFHLHETLGKSLFLWVLCFNSLRAKEGTPFLQGGDGDGDRVEPGVCAASFPWQSSVVFSRPRRQKRILLSSPCVYNLVPKCRLNANCVNTMSSIGFSPDIADRFQGNSGHGTWPFWALLSPLSGAQGHALSLQIS